MVFVAVAGGTGNVGREIIDGILARENHRVLVLTRSNAFAPFPSGVEVIKVDYSNKNQLKEALTGVDVVLSFIIPFLDPGNLAQMNLIDACIKANVRRFVPSEWATASDNGMTVYAGKDEVRAYLAKLNSKELVLEYTCFQPGLFLNYFTYPQKSANHLIITGHYIDFDSGQAILVDDGMQPCTFTTVQDLAHIVALAIEHPGPWPTNGGVQGFQSTHVGIVEMGEKLTGKKFKVHRVSSRELSSSGLTTSWCPRMEHPAFPRDKIEQMSRMSTEQAMKGILSGAWDVAPDWNNLLPEYRFVKPEAWLSQYWPQKA